MKTLFILFVTASTLFINVAVDQTLLEGKWKYSDIYEKEKLDPKSLEMVTKFFSDMKMEFSKNKNYETFMMGRAEKGQWKVNSEKENYIDLTSDKGQVSSLEVISLTKEKLIVSTGKAKFILVRE